MGVVSTLALAAALWSRLPHGDTAFDLLETVVPLTFAAEMNTGGVVSGTPLLIGGNASSWTQTTYRVASVDVTDARQGGVPLVYPDLAFLDRLEVTTASTQVTRGTYAPQIDLIPRAGGTVWRRTLSAGLAPNALQARGLPFPPPIVSLTSWGRGEATAGGPLGGRGLAVFLSASATRSRHRERVESTSLPGDSTSVTAHVTGAVASRLSLFSWMQQTRAPFAGRARFASRDVTAGTRLGGFSAQMRFPTLGALEIAGAIAAGGSRITAGPGAANGTIERLRDGTVPALAGSAPGDSRRAGFNAGWSPVFTKLGRTHSIRSAIEVSSSRATATPAGSGFIGELLNGTPARAWLYGYAGDSRWTQTTAALAASDTVSFGNVTVTAGARLENIRGASAGRASVIRWTDLSPRLRLDWTPKGNAPGRLFASLNRYHSSLPLRLLAYGDPSAAQGSAFRWTDANGDGTVQPAEVGSLLAFVGPGARSPGASTIDRQARRPRLDEFQLGAETNLGVWTLGISAITWKERRLLEAVNVGVPESAYSRSSVFDPGLSLLDPVDDQQLPVYSRPPETFGADAYLLTNPARLNATHQGVTLVVSRRWQDRWNLIAGATALRSKGPAGNIGFQPEDNDQEVPGESYGSPNATTYSTGRVFFDRGYGLKVAASYLAPRGIDLGVVGRYADGQNFARLVIAEDLPQGPEPIRAFNNGRTKFTYTMTLDARAEKRFRIRGGQLSGALESFNLLNTRNEVEEHTVTGPSWRLATATQPPRVVRFMLRAEF